MPETTTQTQCTRCGGRDWSEIAPVHGRMTLAGVPVKRICATPGCPGELATTSEPAPADWTCEGCGSHEWTMLDYVRQKVQCLEPLCAKLADAPYRVDPDREQPPPPEPAPEHGLTDPWQLERWAALERVCLIKGCDDPDICERGPVVLRDDTWHMACTAHWVGVMSPLGLAVTGRR